MPLKSIFKSESYEEKKKKLQNQIGTGTLPQNPAAKLPATVNNQGLNYTPKNNVQPAGYKSLYTAPTPYSSGSVKQGPASVNSGVSSALGSNNVKVNKTPTGTYLFKSAANPLAIVNTIKPQISAPKPTASYTGKQNYYSPTQQKSVYTNSYTSPASAYVSKVNPITVQKRKEATASINPAVNNQGGPKPETVKVSNLFAEPTAQQWKEMTEKQNPYLKNQGAPTTDFSWLNDNRTYEEKAKEVKNKDYSYLNKGISYKEINQGLDNTYIAPGITTAMVDGGISGAGKLFADLRINGYQLDGLAESVYDMNRRTERLSYYPEYSYKLKDTAEWHNAKHGTDGTYKKDTESKIRKAYREYADSYTARANKYAGMPVPRFIHDLSGEITYGAGSALLDRYSVGLGKAFDVMTGYGDRVGRALYDGTDYNTALNYAAAGMGKDVGVEAVKLGGGHIIKNLTSKNVEDYISADKVLKINMEELTGKIPPFGKAGVSEEILQEFAKDTVKDMMKKPEFKIVVEKAVKIFGKAIETYLSEKIESEIIKMTYDDTDKDITLGEIMGTTLSDVILSAVFMYDEKTSKSTQ